MTSTISASTSTPPTSPTPTLIAEKPLRSAMKHSRSHSRPTTPNPLPSPGIKPGFPRADCTEGASGSTLNVPANTSGGYTHKVSFDTFKNTSDQGIFSYTLQVKAEHYVRNKYTRVFLCAASNDESGSNCLEWVLESLIQESDELIVLRGFDSETLDTPGSREAVREEAKKLMSHIQVRSKEIDPSRDISIIVEFVAGKITQTIERLIALYRPDSLIVGTRGQRGMMSSFGAALQLKKIGSVSKWCLSHSPVPVIVVRPERKVRKTMEKRRASSKRNIMFDSPTTPTSASTPGIGSLPLTKSMQ